MKRRNLFIFAVLAALGSGPANAACSFSNEVPIKVLSAAFEAWKSVTDAMAECGNVQASLDQDFRLKQSAAFAANPALYQLGGVANNTIPQLLNEKRIRPLNDLVEKYGQHLKPNQLIKVGGDIVAIAMMVNTQEFAYRKDIFDELGLDVPKTYDQVFEAAEKIRQSGKVDYPLGGMTMSGWNMALEWLNVYASLAGDSFLNADGTPNFNNENGIKALELLKRASEYMDPEYLVSDSTFVQQQMQQGKIAMANIWASRAGAADNEAESKVVGKIYTAASPLAAEDARPVAMLFWDGIVIPRNISDEAAEAAFRVAMEGLDTEMVQAHNDDAVWLIEGYKPGRLAEGAVATASAQPSPISYPMTIEMGLIHSAIGNQISGFFTGAKSAEAALRAAEEEYGTAAREAGLLQ
ncbi:extracellular solute-binding protein [Shinella yambaruensis]|uniref:Sugar ABC transporter substrate-binding protein n=1 Tax=Shinella yambaruensis TaxID=415996 RepID=A0ABQ5ZME2_9HYPH|nr:extracellular solute-binding protein [Shinella yambaruensis]MCJ8028113.1 extracellular solute-binding protein [Shinella yambaruensis]MCU7980405.1 extracellular solute-binding protein [Shinella yambaruensis]GLR52909.1 sugar ABC transporter substrate-binding protein [Shinella yambaruensis]